MGENGPEIVLFGGGERVLTAAESAALTAGGSPAAEPLRALSAPAPASSSISVQFSVSVEGNASPEAVDSIRGYVESPEFKGYILDIFEQGQADAARRRMR